jgi:type III secretion protein L
MDFVLPREPLTDALRPQRFAVRLAPGVQVVRRADWLVWTESQALLVAAREQAERMAVEARDAFEAERRRGYEEGVQAARLEQSQDMIERVAHTAAFYGRVEQRMVDVAMTAVRHIVGGFDDRERVAAVVKGVLEVVRNQKHVILRVAPARVDEMRAGVDAMRADFPGIGFIDVVGEAQLAEDACVAESDLGIVESSVEGQLGVLGRALGAVFGAVA